MYFIISEFQISPTIEFPTKDFNIKPRSMHTPFDHISKPILYYNTFSSLNKREKNSYMNLVPCIQTNKK